MTDKIEKNTEAFERFYAFFSYWYNNSGKTQKEVAPMLGMTQGSFSRFLKHKKPIALSTMEEFSKTIDVDLLDILIEGQAILAGESPGEAPLDPVEAVPAPAPSSATMLDQGRELELLRRIESLTVSLEKKDEILIRRAEALKDKDDKIDRLELRLASLENAMASKMKGEEDGAPLPTAAGESATDAGETASGAANRAGSNITENTQEME